ncbi:MAG: hypothetical protein RLO21_21970 [Nitratireductor sp.]
MTKKQRDHPLQTYAHLMNEIKIRLRAIDMASSGRINIPNGPFLREFCFLQLRMVCELISLGCLVAHGDIKEARTSKLEKEWSADRILRVLSKLHSDFYPTPVIANKTPDGMQNFEAIYDNGCLVQAELPSLYALCGRVLHRGSVKQLHSDRMPGQFDLDEIQTWTKKVVSLLDIHMIVHHDLQSIVICAMGTDAEKVKVFHATAQ